MRLHDSTGLTSAVSLVNVDMHSDYRQASRKPTNQSGLSFASGWHLSGWHVPAFNASGRGSLYGNTRNCLGTRSAVPTSQEFLHEVTRLKRILNHDRAPQNEYSDGREKANVIFTQPGWGPLTEMRGTIWARALLCLSVKSSYRK